MTQHTGFTPGPWGCVDTSNHAHDYRLTSPDGTTLPVNAPANDHGEQRANARLIAAAPSLLAERDSLRAALADLLQHSTEMYPGESSHVEGPMVLVPVGWVREARAALDGAPDEEASASGRPAGSLR